MLEPWLRGTHGELDAVRRQVVHALELASEDVERWCGGLSDAEMHARPFGVASVSYQMRHLVRSLDRLLSYAEGRGLSVVQLAALAAEMTEPGTGAELFAEFRAGLETARAKVLVIAPGSYEEARSVGRKMLPTTVGGLLVHCAEHTQRHVGQAVTTAKVVVGMRAQEAGDANRYQARTREALGHAEPSGIWARGGVLDGDTGTGADAVTSDRDYGG